MNYEQRYNEALDRAKEFYNDESCRVGMTPVDLEVIFPELKESEGEKIRKQIISFLKEFECDHYRSLDFSSWIAWLEKQGEQPKEFTYTHEMEAGNGNINGLVTEKVQLLKFKIGDWIVEPREGKPDGLWHIDRIEDGYYWSDKCGCSIEYADKNFHLWTIQDAKDGDVLVSASNQPFICNGKYTDSTIGAYIGISYDGKEVIIAKSCNWTINKDVKPATKEQRDLLFQKMKEVGYVWDGFKKNLIKL